MSGIEILAMAAVGAIGLFGTVFWLSFNGGRRVRDRFDRYCR